MGKQYGIVFEGDESTQKISEFYIKKAIGWSDRWLSDVCRCSFIGTAAFLIIRIWVWQIKRTKMHLL